MRGLLVLLCLTGCSLAAPLAPPPDQRPIECAACAAWNAPVAPFPLAPGSWYVGTRGLSAVLIDSGDGLVLLDGGLPQSAALIAAHIESLGFRLEQIRYIANSHAHYDHAGGIAALARMSGARVIASPAGAAVLRAGGFDPNDPQHGFGAAMRFPPVLAVDELAAGESLRLGDLELRVQPTPGHTPGGSSWQWRACAEDGRCDTLVFADSLNAVSAPGFAFSAAPAQVAEFRASIARIGELDCDLLIAVHPEFARLFRFGDRGEVSVAPPADRLNCRDYAAAAAERLAARLAAESTAP